MNRTLFILFLFFPAAQAVTAEWILIRPKNIPWESVLDARDASAVVKVFGPDRRFALLGKLPRVVRDGATVQPNLPYRHVGADPDLALSWGLVNDGQPDVSGQVGTPLADIGLSRLSPAAWAAPGVIVGILDSGIDRDHEDLRGNVWRNAGETPGNGVDDDGNGFVDDEWGWNFVRDDNATADDNDHGTLVAGIVGGRADNGRGSRGVVDPVRLMSVKCTDRFGLGTTASAVQAIQYAVENGATILNASWGGETFDPALYETVRWAGERGVLLVAAAGNAGKDHDAGKGANYPAAFRLPNVVAVAAYDNRDRIWAESNFGAASVHLGAPGVNVYGPVRGGYGYGTGTSYAAPFVTGVAAAVLSSVPRITTVELVDRLLATSAVIHPYERYRTLSAGRVHLWQALENVQPARPADPTGWVRRAVTIETDHPYANSSARTFRITHPGAAHLRVHFSAFDTEDRYDVVGLFDETGREALGYSGNRGAFWSAVVDGEVMTIRFTSDYVASRYGFTIDAYEFVPGTGGQSARPAVSSEPSRYSSLKSSKRDPGRWVRAGASDSGLSPATISAASSPR